MAINSAPLIDFTLRFKHLTYLDQATKNNLYSTHNWGHILGDHHPDFSNACFLEAGLQQRTTVIARGGEKGPGVRKPSQGIIKKLLYNCI